MGERGIFDDIVILNDKILNRSSFTNILYIRLGKPRDTIVSELESIA
jgi:hypothetical protein